MSSQHFHDKTLFLWDFRNLALGESVISVGLPSPEAVARLQPVAPQPVPEQTSAFRISKVAPR